MKHRNPITTTPGFRSAGVSCGIKSSGKPDVALIVADDPCVAAGMYTTNIVRAPSVVVTQQHLKSGTARAIVIVSGNANTCVGEDGLRDAREMAALTGKGLGIPPTQVAVACTGIIGVPLPMKKVAAGIEQAVVALGTDPEAAVAEAILTTDTKAKLARRTVRIGGKVAHVGGIAKGSGMIHPNMATMLAFLTTDAELPLDLLQEALKTAVDVSFNSITVDGDMSTSDTVLLLANGRAQHAPITSAKASGYVAFLETLSVVCTDLARQIAADGEGATKLLTVTCKGAPSDAAARELARAVARSNLVKTAAFGNDPNWGRVMAALGSCGVVFNPAKVDIWMNGVQVARQGGPANCNPARTRKAISKPELRIVVDVHAGTHEWTAYSCDLGYDYVKINAEYHT